MSTRTLPRKRTRDELVLWFLIEHKSATLKQLAEASGYPEASVSASLRALRAVGGFNITKEHIGNYEWLYTIHD